MGGGKQTVTVKVCCTSIGYLVEVAAHLQAAMIHYICCKSRIKHCQNDVLAKLSTSDAGGPLDTCCPHKQRKGCPIFLEHSSPLQHISLEEVTRPGVFLCPKLPSSIARDLFESEVSVVSGSFTSHILPHCRMTKMVMSESCLKMFNPKDDAMIAKNYRWISLSWRFPPPPLSLSFLLLLKAQRLQTTKVTVGEHMSEGKVQ